jgi:hypothetical protein
MNTLNGLRAAGVLSVCLMLAACASEPTAATPAPPPAAAEGGEGGSFDTAIVIRDTNERDGVAAEYAWVREHLAGWSLMKQSLSVHAGKPYDQLQLVSPEGAMRVVYFDISAFFGKY